MSEDHPAASETPSADPASADADVSATGIGPTSRRRLLMLGAVSASAVVTIRPALAQTAGSVLNCEIPVPDPARAGNWISPEGKLVAPATPGAFPPAPRPLTGEEVRAAIASRTSSYNGMDYQASRAYTKYIQRLQMGNSGFTCFASLTAPRA